jgi:hypothetical protein
MMLLVRIFCCAVLLFTPHSVHAQANTSASELQSLVNDTAKQLRLSYRHNLTESQARYEQLRRAIEAWKAAARSDANNRLLAGWLRHAMRNSMPGSHEPLLAIPEFDRPTARTEAALPTGTKPQEKVATAKPLAAVDVQGGDPFRDDPGQEASPARADESKK